MTRATTTLGYALLGLIHQQPRSGYDLRKLFETTPMGHFSGSPGAIYPALKKLKERGLITGEVDHSKTLRPREIFQPTTAGTRDFQDWLTRAVDRNAVIWHVNELMLRFAFHSFLDSDDATREFLSDFLNEVKDYLKELRRNLKSMPESVPIHGILALESGIEQYQAYGRWAQKALRHFATTES